jgi:hypothetical protein
MTPVAYPETVGTRLPLAATCLAASAVTRTVEAVALAAMFGAFAAGSQQAGLTFGYVNDVLAIPTVLLGVPAIIELRRLLRPRAPLASDALTALALAATAGVVVLQGLLVLRVVTFEQQFALVTVAFLCLMAWYVAIGVLGSRAGLLRRGGLMGLVGASYFGYPVWAVWMARQLRAVATSGAPERAAAVAAR